MEWGQMNRRYQVQEDLRLEKGRSDNQRAKSVCCLLQISVSVR